MTPLEAIQVRPIQPLLIRGDQGRISPGLDVLRVERIECGAKSMERIPRYFRLPPLAPPPRLGQRHDLLAPLTVEYHVGFAAGWATEGCWLASLAGVGLEDAPALRASALHLTNNHSAIISGKLGTRNA